MKYFGCWRKKDSGDDDDIMDRSLQYSICLKGFSIEIKVKRRVRQYYDRRRHWRSKRMRKTWSLFALLTISTHIISKYLRNTSKENGQQSQAKTENCDIIYNMLSNENYNHADTNASLGIATSISIAHNRDVLTCVLTVSIVIHEGHEVQKKRNELMQYQTWCPNANSKWAILLW